MNRRTFLQMVGAALAAPAYLITRAFQGKQTFQGKIANINIQDTALTNEELAQLSKGLRPTTKTYPYTYDPRTKTISRTT